MHTVYNQMEGMGGIAYIWTYISPSYKSIYKLEADHPRRLVHKAEDAGIGEGSDEIDIIMLITLHCGHLPGVARHGGARARCACLSSELRPCM